MAQALLKPNGLATMAEAYHRDGFVVPDYRLPADVTARLQELTTEMVQTYPDRTGKMFPLPHTHYENKMGFKGPHPEEWFKIATEPTMLDQVEAILGPDIVFWASGLFYKKAEGGPATPWHRDGPYWPIRPMVTVSAWISVFDSKSDNGCLRCIPGSHLAKEWGKHYQSTRKDVIAPITISDDEFDESTAVDIELEPGQMVFFDARTIHGARNNLGTRHRAGYTVRWMAASSHYDHDITRSRLESGEAYDRKDHDKDYASRPIFLVRGVDRSGGLNDYRRTISGTKPKEN